MTDREILEQLLSNQKEMQSDIGALKSDVSVLKSDVETLKSDVNTLKSDVNTLKSDVSDLKTDVRDIQLHLENSTDYRLSILAENHLDLVNKLRDAVKYSDKVALNEISMISLSDRVEAVEKDVRQIKLQLA